MSEVRYLTVTALTKYIKRKFDVDPHLQDVLVKGEISNFKAHSRGHMYFTIKDQNARIQAVMFSGQNRNMKFVPEDGMKVLVRGEISVFESNGNYQIYVKEMQPDGIGNLYLAFEQLKKQLEQEGLFNLDNKKPIPKFPTHIGVITSPTGAAIRDILTTIKRRYPIGKVIILPALVQGQNAPSSIANAISTANNLGYLDVLIVGRGGGSIEELWAFNEEVVAREIFKSKVPVISAVGHETDFTIADFVADLRAPTPTAAAELAVPNMADLADRLLSRKTRLIRALKSTIGYEQERFNKLQNSYAFRHPKNLYVQKEQQLDRLYERLERAGTRNLERQQEKFDRLSVRLKHNHPEEQIKKANERFQQVKKILQKDMKQIVNHKQFMFASTLSKLEALSPLKIMDRGYSLVYDQQETLVKSVKGVKAGESLSVRLQDGKIDCKVVGVEERTLHD
ncbi:exodeoxyribonuclease VII large subunit [Cytobacillus suaedae]|nr:exodeoxyribonuclease VII large subunit [Cytobacillus suaedae]